MTSQEKHERAIILYHEIEIPAAVNCCEDKLRYEVPDP